MKYPQSKYPQKIQRCYFPSGLAGVTSLLIACLPTLAWSEPVTVTSLTKKHVEMRRSLPPMQVSVHRSSHFAVAGKPCSSEYEFEFRFRENISNLRGKRVAYTGFEPTYKTADGVTHKGGLPHSSTLICYFEDKSVFLDIDDPTGIVQYANMPEASDLSLDITQCCRLTSNTVAEHGEVTELDSGLYQISVGATGNKTTLVVDPAREFLVTELIQGDPRIAHRKTRMLSAQKIGGHWYPNAVEQTEFDGGGSVYNRSVISFGQPDFKAVELWMKQIPSGIGVVSGKNMYQADANGQLIKINKTRSPSTAFDVTKLVQFVSLAGLVGFGTVLIIKWQKNRRASGV